MTVGEVFAKLSSHMVEGMMFHEQMANYYDFMSLCGYKWCHEYHYICETLAHRRLNRYYINKYDKLVTEEDIENPKKIPNSWFRYLRHDVDSSTKRNAVKAGLDFWIDWETETKEFYTQMYKELCSMDEITSAGMVKCLICDVEEELKHAHHKRLDLMAIDYNIGSIVSAQSELKHKYKEMAHEIQIGR